LLAVAAASVERSRLGTKLRHGRLSKRAVILKKAGRDVASISSTNKGNQAQNRIEYPSPWESRALTRAPGLFYLLPRLINPNVIHRQTQKVEREL
jgi:hypothetical protein